MWRKTPVLESLFNKETSENCYKSTNNSQQHDLCSQFFSLKRFCIIGCFFLGSLEVISLTHLFRMHSISTTLKHLKNLTVFWCFQGVEKGCIGNGWVKPQVNSPFYTSWRNQKTSDHRTHLVQTCENHSA